MGRAKTTHVAELIFRLGKTKSKLEKIALLEKIRGDDIALEVVYHALNPYWTYGVQPKKVLPIKDLKAAKHIDSALTTQWPSMHAVLSKLKSRKLTGNDAREAAESWGDVLPIMQRILTKDLRCGVHVSTVNKAMGEKWLPTFDVALADEGFVIIKGVIVQRASVEYPVWAEPKYDGVRCATMRGEDDVADLLSRKGKLLENFPSIAAAIQPILEENDFMFDGEVYGNTFKEVMQVLSSKTANDSKLRYRIWDGMPRKHFLEQVQTQTLQERQQVLGQLIMDNDKISRTPGVTVNSEEDVLFWFNAMRAQGLEGLILKPLHLPYSFKRDRSWIKVKEMYTEDYKVIGFAKGDPRKKYKNTLGALVVDVAGVEVEVASGLQEKDRAEIWKHKKKYLGRWLEVKFQEKTEAGSLRVPTINRDEGGNIKWRIDRDLDDA